MTMHRKMAETLDTVMDEIKAIQKNARENHDTTRPKWPMIVLRTPKGWTGPKVVDGKQIEGSFRAHQVPIMMDKPEHLEMLKEWLLSYHPEELFDENGKLIPELKALAPTGDRRIGSNPHANGGKLLRDLRLPDFRDYALDVPAPGSVEAQDRFSRSARFNGPTPSGRRLIRVIISTESGSRSSNPRTTGW